jgi:hypothetical protein
MTVHDLSGAPATRRRFCERSHLAAGYERLDCNVSYRACSGNSRQDLVEFVIVEGGILPYYHVLIIIVATT